MPLQNIRYDAPNLQQRQCRRHQPTASAAASAVTSTAPPPSSSRRLTGSLAQAHVATSSVPDAVATSAAAVAAGSAPPAAAAGLLSASAAASGPACAPDASSGCACGPPARCAVRLTPSISAAMSEHTCSWAGQGRCSGAGAGAWGAGALDSLPLSPRPPPAAPPSYAGPIRAAGSLCCSTRRSGSWRSAAGCPCLPCRRRSTPERQSPAEGWEGRRPLGVCMQKPAARKQQTPALASDTPLKAKAASHLCVTQALAAHHRRRQLPHHAVTLLLRQRREAGHTGAGQQHAHGLHQSQKIAGGHDGQPIWIGAERAEGRGWARRARWQRPRRRPLEGHPGAAGSTQRACGWLGGHPPSLRAGKCSAQKDWGGRLRCTAAQASRRCAMASWEAPGCVGGIVEAGDSAQCTPAPRAFWVGALPPPGQAQQRAGASRLSPGLLPHLESVDHAAFSWQGGCAQSTQK